MKNKLLHITLLGASIIPLGGAVHAHKNPINQDYVQLSIPDWSAACSAGLLNSSSGCYGDINSVAFAKIDRISNGILVNNGISGSGPSTLWLRQLGAGTTCAAQEANINVQVSATLSTDWNCGVYTLAGQNVSRYNGTIGYAGTWASGVGVALRLIATGTGPNLYAFTTLQYSGAAPSPPLIMLCISAESGHSGTATSFQQSPRAAIGGNLC